MLGSILDFLFAVFSWDFGILNYNFEIFITPFNFHQIELPGTVLNAELRQLSETVIGIKIWPCIDREMIVLMSRGI